MSTWASVTNLFGPTGPLGQSSWTPYFGNYPDLVKVGTPAGTFFSDGLTGNYYPVIRSFQRYTTASMYLNFPSIVIGEKLTAGLSSNLDLSYVSTNNPSEFSVAWIIDYPTVNAVCDHGQLSSSSFTIKGGDSLGIVYDEAQINFIYNGCVFCSVRDPNILKRMQCKTLFLDVCCSGTVNIENLVFSCGGARGTMIYGSTGLPGISGNSALNSRVGDLYIDYSTGIIYRYQI